MPGEGFPVAISKVTGIEFPKVKIVVDVSLVLLGIVFCYIFFGKWQWHIIGVGTLFAMYYVGWAVRIASHHLKWFDRLLKYRPGIPEIHLRTGKIYLQKVGTREESPPSQAQVCHLIINFAPRLHNYIYPHMKN